MMTIALVAVLAAAGVQQSDDRWAAFEGCWVPQVEDTQATPAHMLCVRGEAAGVTFRTYVNGKLENVRALQADGVAHAVAEGGCTGTEKGQWSADGRRVFVSSELKCANTQRGTSMVLAFVSGETFASVQSVKVGGETSVQAMKYRAVGPSQYPAEFQLAGAETLARQTARLNASAALTPENVIEASRLATKETVAALVAARRSAFALTPAVLRQLKAEGVAPSTIDVMVAVSNPTKFAVGQLAAQAAPEENRTWRPTRALDDPYRDYTYGYNRYGWNDYFDRYCSRMSLGWYGGLYSGFGNNPCYSGYGYYNGFGWPYGSPYGYPYGGGVVVVVPVDPTTGQPVQGGSVSADGYRRGTQATKGTAQPRSHPSTYQPAGSTVSGGGGSSGGSSSGSGSVGSGGHSAGAGSTSTGQTAKPRGGGES